MHPHRANRGTRRDEEDPGADNAHLAIDHTCASLESVLSLRPVAAGSDAAGSEKASRIPESTLNTIKALYPTLTPQQQQQLAAIQNEESISSGISSSPRPSRRVCSSTDSESLRLSLSAELLTPGGSADNRRALLNRLQGQVRRRQQTGASSDRNHDATQPIKKRSHMQNKARRDRAIDASHTATPTSATVGDTQTKDAALPAIDSPTKSTPISPRTPGRTARSTDALSPSVGGRREQTKRGLRGGALGSHPTVTSPRPATLYPPEPLSKSSPPVGASPSSPSGGSSSTSPRHLLSISSLLDTSRGMPTALSRELGLNALTLPSDGPQPVTTEEKLRQVCDKAPQVSEEYRWDLTSGHFKTKKTDASNDGRDNQTKSNTTPKKTGANMKRVSPKKLKSVSRTSEPLDSTSNPPSSNVPSASHSPSKLAGSNSLPTASVSASAVDTPIELLFKKSFRLPILPSTRTKQKEEETPQSTLPPSTYLPDPDENELFVTVLLDHAFDRNEIERVAHESQHAQQALIDQRAADDAGAASALNGGVSLHGGHHAHVSQSSDLYWKSFFDLPNTKGSAAVTTAGVTASVPPTQPPQTNAVRTPNGLLITSLSTFIPAARDPLTGITYEMRPPKPAASSTDSVTPSSSDSPAAAASPTGATPPTRPKLKMGPVRLALEQAFELIEEYEAQFESAHPTQPASSSSNATSPDAAATAAGVARANTNATDSPSQRHRRPKYSTGESTSDIIRSHRSHGTTASGSPRKSNATRKEIGGDKHNNETKEANENDNDNVPSTTTAPSMAVPTTSTDPAVHVYSGPPLSSLSSAKSFLWPSLLSLFPSSPVVTRERARLAAAAATSARRRIEAANRALQRAKRQLERVGQEGANKGDHDTNKQEARAQQADAAPPHAHPHPHPPQSNSPSSKQYHCDTSPPTKRFSVFQTLTATSIDPDAPNPWRTARDTASHSIATGVAHAQSHSNSLASARQAVTDAELRLARERHLIASSELDALAPTLVNKSQRVQLGKFLLHGLVLRRASNGTTIRLDWSVDQATNKFKEEIMQNDDNKQ